MTKLLTSNQLADLVRPDEDRAIDALRNQDISTLKNILSRMGQGHAGLDALSIHTIARKVGKLRQDIGEEVARNKLQSIGEQLMQTWIRQFRAGDIRGAITDLVAVFKYQAGAAPQPLNETANEVILELRPCGSGGRLEKQGFPEKYPQWYGDWSDGVSSYCQACKANQAAINSALGAPVWTTEKSSDGVCTLRFAKLGCEGKPLFTDDEHHSLVQTRVQIAEAALADGDFAIEPLLRGQRKEWMPWHDFAIVWLEYFYATALEIGGAAYLDEFLHQTYEPAFYASFPRYAAMTDVELVAEIARTWNYHMADFVVTENDDCFVFSLDPCGSGGRLFRGNVWRNMFRYGESLAPLISEPHPINFLRRDAPTYCTHCAASNRAQLAGAENTPLFFIIDGHAQQRPGDPCRQFTFKKGERGVGKFLAQIGLSETTHDPKLTNSLGEAPCRKK